MENDYKNSVIYRIYCKNPDITECYIGSTKCFEDRFYTHKSVCNTKHNKRHNLYLYQFIRDNGGWNNFDREILEYYDCNNEEELKQKEQEYIDKYNPTLNIHNAFRTEEVRKEQQKTNFKKWKKTEKGRESVLNSCRKRTEKLMNDPERYQKKLKNKSEWGKKPKFCEVCNLWTTNNMWYKHKKTKLHLDNVEKS
jgi:group I intron endonuclease